MKDQAELLWENWDHIIILDGARYDAFKQMYKLELEGELHEVYNRGCTWTVQWFHHHFTGRNPHTIFHGGAPLYAYTTNPYGYDERDHFEEVVPWEDFEWSKSDKTVPPREVTNAVREQIPRKSVIRYLQPHNPYRQLPDVVTISDASNHSENELKTAYYDNLRWVMAELSNNLLPYLDGRVCITSDHGQCLGDCGQYLHGPHHKKHRHLTSVPFFEVMT